jgi:hypothetical protein
VPAVRRALTTMNRFVSLLFYSQETSGGVQVKKFALLLDD